MEIEQNKAMVRRFIERGTNPANMAVFDELLAADVRDYYAPPGVPPGREGWKLTRQLFLAGFPDGRWEIAELIAEGDLVVARCPFSGTHQGEFFGVLPSDRRVVISSIYICRVVSGRIVEHWDNGNDPGLMQQIGAIPAPALAA